MACQILNYAETWVDEYNLTWLASAPKIKLFRVTEQKPAYPLDWDEQERLFSYLAPHHI